MKASTLGCRGKIVGHLRNTSMLLDNDILIDAGAGMGGPGFKRLARTNQVFVSHSHLAHVGYIPILVDSAGWMCNKSITVHAAQKTQKISNHKQEMLRHNRIIVF